MKTVTFGNSDYAKREMLNLLGKSVDSEGFIVDNKTGERVVSPTNEEVHLSRFAGIRKGSEIFITNDLPALLEQAEHIEV